MGEASAKTRPVPNLRAWRAAASVAPVVTTLSTRNREGEPPAAAHKLVFGCGEPWQPPATTSAGGFNRRFPAESTNHSGLRAVFGSDISGEDQVGFDAAGARRNGNECERRQIGRQKPGHFTGRDSDFLAPLERVCDPAGFGFLWRDRPRPGRHVSSGGKDGRNEDRTGNLFIPNSEVAAKKVV